MKTEVLFNDGWEFSRQKLDTTLEEMRHRENEFAPVGIPHDWLIGQVQNLYESGTGWYRKIFEWQRTQGELVSLCFDGVYMDCRVYVNGKEAGEWKYGYSAFEVEMTPYLQDGENEVWVSVRYQSPNSRWYSGAGIYRDVRLRRVQETHIPRNGIYVTTKKLKNENWWLETDTEIICKSRARLVYTLCDAEGRIVWNNEETLLPQKDVILHTTTASVGNPVLWDVENPVLYRLRTALFTENGKVQEEEVSLGFRETAFCPDSGFSLNGRHLKLNGVCEHHDLGCLGAAFNRTAMRRKLKILKEMGVNAVRLTHNMPASAVMELADEMGVLMISEAFDMWERAKTTYDYARFFREWYPRDVESWVRRDRNHPSLIMWSIGNEIYDTHADDSGQRIARELLAEVKKHDPKNHAPVTIGSNYMPWENARKCADIVEAAGYNYSEKYYEAHHREHPDWIIYGSETSSTVQSRGIYHFPYRQSVLAEEDLQCSALGNSTTSWGAKSSESCILAERDCDFSCGQFLWSGFDYIGEPTPYHTKNSYFGQIDTAGFPKDSYYIYQAEWTDAEKAPMVHIFPYWDFNEGQSVDVRVCSNAPEVELFVNGKSQGRYRIDHRNGMQLTGNWIIPYEAGEIEAVAYDEKGAVTARQARHSFGEAAQLCLKPDKREVLADGEDLIFVEITARDAQGYPVENANNRVKVRVEGAGRLVGLDNGDSTDRDEYKGDSRRLFSGKLLAVIAAVREAGEIIFSVASPGVTEAEERFYAKACEPEEGISFVAYGMGTGCKSNRGYDGAGKDADSAENGFETGTAVQDAADNIFVRKIELICETGTKLDETHPSTEVHARICPANASDRELIFALVDDAGIPSNLAKLETEGDCAKITAMGDGSFFLRCMSKCGQDHVEIISQLDFTVTGIGTVYVDPYGFVCGGQYQYSKGDVGNGNEKGVATARDGETQVGYRNLDFGSFGADEITVPIFALTSEAYPIQIWEGMPGEKGSVMVADVVYQKPSRWNTYQPETWKLNKRLKGITSLCFVLNQKVHIKGFSFIRKNRAFEMLSACECDNVYGDSFTVTDSGIDGIGNNVTVEFHDMDFGESGISGITICGRTPLENNAVHVRFGNAEGEIKQLVTFPHREEAEEIHFTLEKVTGIQNVTFVFLPGSQFDFQWFRFEE